MECMKNLLFSLILLTLTFGFLLVFLNPQETIEEVGIANIETPQISTPEITIYVSSQKIALNQIKIIMAGYDVSSFSSGLDQYGKSLVEDLEVQLEEISSKNATIYASMRINEFKEVNDQIKGVYLNGYLFNNDAKREQINEILVGTDVNTLVIDVKTDNGHILFDTEIDEVSYLENIRAKYTKSDLQELKEIKDLYLIG